MKTEPLTYELIGEARCMHRECRTTLLHHKRSNESLDASRERFRALMHNHYVTEHGPRALRLVTETS